MTDTRAFKPYSSLPEPFALVAAAVWVNLLAAAYPTVSTTGLLVRAVVYGMLLAVAAGHSWLFARGTLVSGGAQKAAVSAGWLLLLALVVAWLEAGSKAPLVGVLVFMQVAQCSFVFNHATLRLTHLVSFSAMLVSTLRLPLAGGGAAWLAFSVLSMLVLAYGRTASKAGPASYDLGETRRVAHRLTLVSCVALVAAFLFLLTPMLSWPDSGKRPPRGGVPRPQPTEPRGDHPFGIDGSTTLDDDNANLQVMYVTTKPSVSGPLYLRGQTFDTFDGANWENSALASVPLVVSGDGWTPLEFGRPRAQTVRLDHLTQTFTMYVNMRGALFSACRPTHVQFPDGASVEVLCDPADRSMRVDGTIVAGRSYRVDGFQEAFSSVALAGEDPGAVGVRYRQLPDGIDPQVYALAWQQTAGATSAYDKALALERYLHGPDFSYSLDHGIGGPQVVNDFLLRVRRGHCALFASSMVVMARIIGLPARYITGFLAQDRSGDGFSVRGSDAHAWVEVYVGDAGWIAFDPTSGRVAPSDAYTRDVARGAGHNDERTNAGVERGGGLYGRDGRDFSASGNQSGPGGGDNGTQIASNGNGAGGAGTPGVGQNGANGAQGGNGGAGPAGGSGPNGRDGGSGGNGGIAGGNAPNGGTPADRPGASGASTPAPAPTPPRPAVPDPNRTVVAPGGSTAPPPVAGERTGERVTSAAPSPGAPVPTLGPDDEPPVRKPATPEEVEGEWRLLVLLLMLVGVAGVVLLLVWQRVARRVVETRTIREALPIVVEDDPDPRRAIVKLYHAMVTGLGRVGFPKRESETPGDFAAAVARRDGSLGESVGDLTELFHAARYDDVPVTPDDASRARSVWGRIARSVTSIRTEPDA